jgi:hypothetical protein
MKYFYFIIMYANIGYLRTLANLGQKKSIKNTDFVIYLPVFS